MRSALVDDDYPVSLQQRNLAVTRWLWHVSWPSLTVLSRGLGSSKNANGITLGYCLLHGNGNNVKLLKFIEISDDVYMHSRV